jgi:hypothetical protein
MPINPEKLYLKPAEELLDVEVTLRQVIKIDEKYYAIIVIGALCTSTGVQVVIPHPERCIVLEINPNTGKPVNDIMYNVILTKT